MIVTAAATPLVDPGLTFSMLDDPSGPEQPSGTGTEPMVISSNLPRVQDVGFVLSRKAIGCWKSKSTALGMLG